MCPETVVLKARDDRAACLATHGCGSCRSGVPRRSRRAGASVLCRDGWCGCLLGPGVGPGGLAGGRWPGEVRPDRRPGGPARRVCGPQAASRKACMPTSCLRGNNTGHARDRRIGGRIGQGLPGTRAGRGLPRRLPVPCGSPGAARDRRGVCPASGLLHPPRPCVCAGIAARCGTGRACQVRGACRMRQGSGPGGAARVEHCCRVRRGFVVSRLCLIGSRARGRHRPCLIGGPARGRRACVLGGHACAGPRPATRRLRCRRRRSGHRDRLHRDRIPDRPRRPRRWNAGRGRLDRERVTDRSRILWPWWAIAARRGLARARTGLRQR